MARGALLAYVISIIHGIFWFHIIQDEFGSIFLFEMPLIFMISGAAYYISWQNNQSLISLKYYLNYVLRRCIRILVPYMGYALVCSALMIKYSDHVNIFNTLVAWLNPVQHGAGHSTSMLNWHLWFVVPFLAVSVLLPALIFLRKFPKKLPLWAWVLGATFLVHANDLLDTSKSGWIQMVVFYLIWAAFGFSLAAEPIRFSTRSYLTVFSLSLFFLASVFIFFPSYFNLNMQANKFPPNAIFFIFSCAWVSIILAILKKVDRKHISSLNESYLLKPFISAGYSIYLWQGLGYSIAHWLGTKLGLSILITFPLAIALTIALGLLFFPLERLRLR